MTPGTDALEQRDDGLRVFDAVRPRLFGIAYRMLGSVAEAEDIVQSAWLRWQVTDRGAVVDADAFLVTVTTRLAINQAKSARVQREHYAGVWLPEPIDTSTDPCVGAERAEGLELAVLMLLEKLAPTERAAYVLREAFDYPYDRIAEVLRLTTVNARQLVSRARQHITNGRQMTAGADEHHRLLLAFVAAARKGDASALEDLFAAD
ncbi:MAG TPA: sigma-70 family RNA polymerase sigma factor, partial [Phycisphaerae bacterium]|nr:sigma-70 family RNA polymerase sigma factor [Phycisphaerae bacterium]